MHRQGDHQLGLGAGFETEVVVLAGVEDFFDDLAQLVDLDGEHPAVFAFVSLFCDGFAEGLVELDHAVAQQILEAHDQRRLQAHVEGLADNVHHAHAAAVAQRLDGDLPVGFDLVVAGAPAFEAVEVF